MNVLAFSVCVVRVVIEGVQSNAEGSPETISILLIDKPRNFGLPRMLEKLEARLPALL